MHHRRQIGIAVLGTRYFRERKATARKKLGKRLERKETVSSGNKAVVKCLVQRAAALTCLLIQKRNEISDDDNCIGIKEREREREKGNL